MKRPVVLVLGPSREAISGVSTHVNMLFDSALARQFSLVHFQVGSEGRAETRLRRVARLAASPFLLARAVVDLGAQIVHLNTTLDARAYWRDLAYLIVAKLCGVRVVYQVHGGALPRDFFRNPLLTALLKAVLRWPEVVVVLAESELRAYEAFVPGRNVVMLPNGIDCAAYAVPRRPLASAGTPLNLIYLGRLATGKGLPETLQALRLARAHGVSARLVIAGSGPEERSLRDLAGKLGLKQDVTFVGPSYGADKVKLFAGADVMLLPSYSEGLPYALLEAMAAGVVPIVTRVGAMPDVITEGIHGMLVPPRDAGAIARAIVALGEDRARLGRMSTACCRRVADGYSIGRVAADFAGLYSGLGATRSPSAAV
jgi:glycosyltransferase involved in cell wall biosynthesis